MKSLKKKKETLILRFINEDYRSRVLYFNIGIQSY